MIMHSMKVAFLYESIFVSGYPMQADSKEEDFWAAKKRAEKLGKAVSGSGHDCFLKGISVFLDIEATQAWWMQFQRYHFADIVSSQSKMHMITKMELSKKCHPLVSAAVISEVEKLIAEYNVAEDKDKPLLYEKIIYNTPSGLYLRAGVTTNYLQLKTMFKQRKNHRLTEWRVFLEYILTLPKFSKLIGLDNTETEVL